eukprot:31303-Pelagococcus_subviridis.AAC.22
MASFSLSRRSLITAFAIAFKKSRSSHRPSLCSIAYAKNGSFRSARPDMPSHAADARNSAAFAYVPSFTIPPFNTAVTVSIAMRLNPSGSAIDPGAWTNPFPTSSSVAECRIEYRARNPGGPMYALMSALSTNATSIASVMFDVVNTIAFGFFFSASICVRSAFTTRIAFNLVHEHEHELLLVLAQVLNLLEQPPDELPGLAEPPAEQRVRVHLHERRGLVRLREGGRETLRQRFAHRRLPRPRGAVQEHDAVPRDEVGVDLALAEQQRVPGVSRQSSLHVGVEDERLPQAVEIARRERPLAKRRDVVLAVHLLPGAVLVELVREHAQVELVIAHGRALRDPELVEVACGGREGGREGSTEGGRERSTCGAHI